MKYLALAVLSVFLIQWCGDNIRRISSPRPATTSYHGKACGRAYRRGGIAYAIVWFALNILEMWAMSFAASAVLGTT